MSNRLATGFAILTLLVLTVGFYFTYQAQMEIVRLLRETRDEIRTTREQIQQLGQGLLFQQPGGSSSR
ncbi:hypothetical protein GBSOP10_10828 [Armatimonadetes bacterium GBS]|jgi:CHASE3 domain sensor protein|nr:hypothetical protein GBSOP10_10828 [Armatimonadetes bacterium GBS]CUU34217.1 hypothetical protein GXSOP10_1134 [Armatimonadetes bacterium GXS]